MSGGNISAEAKLPEDLLVASLIHEMRQPLTGLHACLSFVATDLGATVSDNQDWQLAQVQITRLQELCETYEEFLNPRPPPIEGYDAASVSKWAADLMSHRLRELGERFTLEVGSNLPQAGGHAAALRHTMANVLKNGTEAIDVKRGEGRLAVRVLRNPEGQIEIRISNNGPPIPAERGERIFEARFSTKGNEGRGLGLFISRIMLERAGSAIGLTAPDDPRRLPWATVEFCVTLPAADPDAAQGESAPAPDSTGVGVSRILVVDDEPIILQILQIALERRGCSVTTAATVGKGRALLAEEQFDLLVTDKNLPDGNGIDLVKNLRDRKLDTAVILITGYASTESADQVMPLQIDDYVCKPFDVESLAGRIEQILDQRRKRPLGGSPVRSSREAVVLVVGPDEPFEEGVRVALEEVGVDVEVFADAGAALAARPQALRLVVSETRCDEAARQLLQAHRAEIPGVHLAMVGSNRNLSSRIGAILLGARAVIPVPLPGTEELDRALRRALGLASGLGSKG